MKAIGVAVAAAVALLGLAGTASASTITYQGHLAYDWSGPATTDGVVSSHGDVTVMLDENGRMVSASSVSTHTRGDGSSFTLSASDGGAVFFFDFAIGNFDGGDGPGPYDINFNANGVFTGSPFAGAGGHARVVVWTPDTDDWLLHDHLGQVGDPGVSNTNTPYAYLSIVTQFENSGTLTTGLTYNYTVQAVPEPASVSLAVLGLGAAARLARRRRKA